jgi:hypothetical protein
MLEAWPEGEERSSNLSLSADVCCMSGHPDLALMAVQLLLESPSCQGDPKRQCSALLTLANSWNQLGQQAASAAVNQQALDLALAHHQYADAASASTNLAANDANCGRLSRALERLHANLGFLRQDANPRTDAITRLALLQVVDALEAEPAIALNQCTPLFSTLARQVGRDDWAQVAPAFHRLVDRHLAATPQLDGETWKRTTYPWVFGEMTQ